MWKVFRENLPVKWRATGGNAVRFIAEGHMHSARVIANAAYKEAVRAGATPVVNPRISCGGSLETGDFNWNVWFEVEWPPTTTNVKLCGLIFRRNQ